MFVHNPHPRWSQMPSEDNRESVSGSVVILVTNSDPSLSLLTLTTGTTNYT